MISIQCSIAPAQESTPWWKVHKTACTPNTLTFAQTILLLLAVHSQTWLTTNGSLVLSWAIQLITKMSLMWAMLRTMQATPSSLSVLSSQTSWIRASKPLLKVQRLKTFINLSMLQVFTMGRSFKTFYSILWIVLPVEMGNGLTFGPLILSDLIWGL